MKILITGYTGFIGRNFLKNYGHIYDIIGLDLIKLKISDIEFPWSDSVLHLAALVHQMKGASESQYFNVNRDLAYQVAKKAKAEGVKHFVFMSTAKVLGESTTGKPAWNEYSECHPQDAYGRSKYEAEKLLLELQDENFKVAIVRSPLVYGAGVKANMYNLVKLVHQYSLLPLGGIDNRRSMVFVGNLVALLKQIIETRASGIFIAGDLEPLSTTRLTNMIADAGEKKVILLKVPDFARKIFAIIKPSVADRLFGSFELDNYSTNKKLGFTPPYTTEYGIREMVEWYNSTHKL